MRILTVIALSVLALAGAAQAEPADKPIKVTVEGRDKAGFLDKKYAACIATKDGKSTKGENRRPTVSWTDGPEGTLSYAIVVSDADVPADLSIANQEELLIAGDMPRQTFYHWVQYNIDAKVREVPGGDKPPGFGYAAENDVSHGTDKLGYGGPCPPWNDALVHRYRFAVYALDVKRLPLKNGPPARKLLEAIEPHVLAKGEQVVKFTLNPALRKGRGL